MSRTAYPHLAANPRIAGGAPIIKGTRITVRTIAGYYQLGMSVDEILQSLPHLTQSQVHAALAFYFDHQRAIDRELGRNADLDYWRKQVKPASSVEDWVQLRSKLPTEVRKRRGIHSSVRLQCEV